MIGASTPPQALAIAFVVASWGRIVSLSQAARDQPEVALGRGATSCSRVRPRQCGRRVLWHQAVPEEF